MHWFKQATYVLAVWICTVGVTVADFVINPYRFGGASTLQQQLATSPNSERAVGIGSSTKFIATRFTASGTYTLTRVDVSLKKINSPTAEVTAYLYANGGTVPTTLLATSTNTITSSTLPTAFSGKQTFNFPATALTSATNYHVAVSLGTTNATNYIAWEGQTGGGRVDSSADGSSWSFFETKNLVCDFYGY